MRPPRLHWMRGRQEEGPGVHRTLEWIGRDDAGETIARVVVSDPFEGPVNPGTLLLATPHPVEAGGVH